MQKEFIEVDRVLSNKVTKENVATERECVDISLIKTFRGWHKGDKDRAISGDMTLLILMPDKDNEFVKKTDEEIERMLPNEIDEYEKDLEKYNESKKKSHSIIIEESYSSFRDRIGTKVVVRKIE